MTPAQVLLKLLDWLTSDPAHIMVTASAIAAVTPTPNPASVFGKLYRVLEILALNFFKAKDTGAVAPKE